MRTTIDKAGRIVVPKRLRDALGMSPGTELEILAVDNRLEIEMPQPRARLVDGPDGLPLVDAPDARGLTTQDVRSWRLRLQDPEDRFADG
ncbi:MAG: AbrB/MazE/SpoVT family DNA-binding domain-containing protein [Solirubrobacteraceae bacterium]